MAATTKDTGIRVVVQADKSAAELLIPPGADRAMVTIEACEAVLRGSGVEVSPPVRKAVADLLSRPTDPAQVLRGVVARATPARHGEDGRVEWLVHPPAEIADKAAAAKDPHKQSFYDRSAFIMVKRGEVVGKIHPPTPGEDGRDVLGKTIPARAGKECAFKFDESLLCDASGSLIAQDEGVLVHNDAKAYICRVLEVPDYVDFSTGNIDFHGDVIVGKGVRDLFTVKATGNIEVRGLIEAATIIAGNDLIAHGGFAGRERGAAQVAGLIRAKYLDNIHGEVLRDLCIDREIINCELTVHGAVNSPHGAIIGGRIVVTGKVHVGMLGSGAGTPTQLVVGSVPRLEPLHEKLQGFVEKVSARHTGLVEEQDQLNKLVGKRRATAADKERQTELFFEISHLENLLRKARPTLERLKQRIDEQRTVDVHVERKLHSGVMLIVGGDEYRIASDVRGPLRIFKDGRAAMYRVGEGPATMLAQVADVHVLT